MTSSEAEAMVANMADLGDEIPPENLEGQEFKESVMTKAQDILDNIQKHDRVTPGQESALENMHRGLAKWVR